MNILRKVFKILGIAIRKTPLRKSRLLSSIHDWLFDTFLNKGYAYVDGNILYFDKRDRTISKKLQLYGEYESFIREVLVDHASPGALAVDIGANIGLHTIPMAKKVGKTGKIIAFEPDPDNYHLLLKNINANGLDNIETHNFGLSSENGEASLFQSSVNRGGLSLCEKNVIIDDEHKISVTIKLKVADDLLLDMANKISLVKIDVEGAEPLVLAGMKKTLSRNNKINILFEYSPEYIKNFGYNPLSFLKEIEELGYQLYKIDEDNESIIKSNADDIFSFGAGSDYVQNILAKSS